MRRVRRRRHPIADGIRERQRRQRADDAAARARVAADAASLNAAPVADRLTENQPTINERERDAAFNYLRHD